MKTVILIAILGYGILVWAILLNVSATKFGLKTASEYFKSPQCTSATSYVWLIFAYPSLLGIGGYALYRLLFGDS